MAGLFERMGLVRTEYEGMPEIPMQPVSEPMYAPETPVIDATQVSYDDVIASIYQQGDIDDENSIFKIKAYIDILPQDMTKAKKQASIAGILSVNGINVDDSTEFMDFAYAHVTLTGGCMLIQAYAGIPHDERKLTLKFIYQSTGEVMFELHITNDNSDASLTKEEFEEKLEEMKQGEHK